AEVGVALGDHTVKRRYDALEGLQVPQARYVGRRRLLRGGFGGRITGTLIRILLGDRLGGEQPLPALVGGARQLIVGLRSGQIGLCLVQLLIHFRSIDLREQLSLLYRRADVGIPALEVAAGARVDRRG